jgi:hypothetical protein
MKGHVGRDPLPGLAEHAMGVQEDDGWRKPEKVSQAFITD